MYVSGAQIGLHHLALTQHEVASGRGTDLAEQGTGTIAFGGQAVVQIITLALNDHP
ncbi:hypothetical protein D3C76_1458450 [compost metagenome]